MASQIDLGTFAIFFFMFFCNFYYYLCICLKAVMTWLEFSLFYARNNTVLLNHTCFSCGVHLLWLFIRNIENRKD
jgi:hypothetical protein